MFFCRSVPPSTRGCRVCCGIWSSLRVGDAGHGGAAVFGGPADGHALGPYAGGARLLSTPRAPRSRLEPLGRLLCCALDARARDLGGLLGPEPLPSAGSVARRGSVLGLFLALPPRPCSLRTNLPTPPTPRCPPPLRASWASLQSSPPLLVLDHSFLVHDQIPTLDDEKRRKF